MEELNTATHTIMTELCKDIKEIGAPIADLEARMDDTTTVLASHDSDLAKAHATIQDLQLHLEDLENRSRCSNLRIRGLPEIVEDLPGTIITLLQELVHDVPLDRLEFDRIHRALSPRKDMGLPGDIIA